MSERCDRRAVFAHAVLTGSPVQLTQQDDSSLRIEFASIADLRDWLATTGLDTPGRMTAATATPAESVGGR